MTADDEIRAQFTRIRDVVREITNAVLLVEAALDQLEADVLYDQLRRAHDQELQ